MDSEILITPDLTGFIIGVDWLEKQGRFEWNFRNGQIKFEDEEWLDLQPEETSRRVRRVIVSKDTVIPPTAQTNVDVRIKHRKPKDKPYLGFVENGEVPSLKQVYNARSLIPAKFSHIQVPVLNAANKSQVLPKGTDLGILQQAEAVEEIKEFATMDGQVLKDELSIEQNGY